MMRLTYREALVGLLLSAACIALIGAESSSSTPLRWLARMIVLLVAAGIMALAVGLAQVGPVSPMLVGPLRRMSVTSAVLLAVTAVPYLVLGVLPVFALHDSLWALILLGTFLVGGVPLAVGYVLLLQAFRVWEGGRDELERITGIGSGLVAVVAGVAAAVNVFGRSSARWPLQAVAASAVFVVYVLITWWLRRLRRRVARPSPPLAAAVEQGIEGLDWLRVPGAKRPETYLSIGEPAYRVGGFRFARTADDANDDGTPRVSPQRGFVTDPAQRERLVGYLTGGASVVPDGVRGADRIDPTRQFAVPASFRTDGIWVWAGSVEYYLRFHGVGLEPEFRDHIEGANYRCPPVEPGVVALALAAVDERAKGYRRMVEAYLAEHPEARPGEPDRFPAEVNDALLALGWQRGRDLGAQVDEWLSVRVPALAALPFERDGYPRYEPFPAAVAVMREFGGLTSLANGRGQTSAQVPFVIYPTQFDDLVDFAPDVQMLGELVGSRVFQVGEVERGMGALVVAEDGRVFLAGPIELYAGRNFDEALVRMLLGLRCEELDEVGL
jgi:SUKH-3 immunity protein